MPRRPHALVPLALAGLLAGCGSSTASTPGTGAPQAPTTTGSALGAPTSTAPLPTTTPVCATPADPVKTTGPAADKFGATQMMTAYAFATGLLTGTTFTETPLADPQPPQTAFAAAEAGLTPRARDSFRELTAKLESTTVNLSDQDTADLVSLVTWGVPLTYPGLTLRDPAYRDVTCGKATTETFARPGLSDALVLRFPITGTFLLKDASGKPQMVVFGKQMDLSLESTGDPARPWLLDGWRGTRTVDGPKPDTSS